MVATELLVRVASLRDLRACEAQIGSMLDERRDAFQVENAPLIEAARNARNAVVAAETALRAVASDEYAKTQEPKLCPGVTVKLFSTLDYDEKQALEWAKKTGMALLPESLDRKAFEKIAKATPLPFVQYASVPTVTVASDLDKALSSVDADAATPTEVSV